MVSIRYILIVGLSILTWANSICSQTFTLFTKGEPTSVFVSEKENSVVKMAVSLFSEDMKNVFDIVPSVCEDILSGKVVIGTVGCDKELDRWLQELGINMSELRDHWEAFSLQTVKVEGKYHLIILGSDPRGTAYGLLELSRLMGISPWCWWADVTPEKRERLDLPINYKNKQQPSVKYRGIFLNDEDWGLSPWSARNFEQSSVKNEIGTKTYTRIFELLLRLRANTLWPAMHKCSTPFYWLKGAKELAAQYGIVIGTSHCEPLMRNNVGEWNRSEDEEYNYVTNKELVNQYWSKRLEEVCGYENIYTLGMRGIHDGKMNGVESLDEQTELLSCVIANQRSLLQKYIDKNVEQIPQVIMPYKEVLDIYDNGLKIPDDVTLVWCDDNYGYIPRLSNIKEQKRIGGAGVYYHISYFGRPHDYLWLYTTPPALIYTEMKRAWEYGARKLWMLNVGDIKPGEYGIEFFLDLAWNIDVITAEGVSGHLARWLRREFGKDASSALLPVMEEYFRLASIRRPEFMGWNRVEEYALSKRRGGITPVENTDFNPFVFGDEIQQRIDDYTAIADKVMEYASRIVVGRKDAYFEMIQYPVCAAAAMNRKMLYAQKARFFATRGMSVADEYASKSRDAYNEIAALTMYYNKIVGDGKWDGIMDMMPRRLPVFDPPVLPNKVGRGAGVPTSQVWPEGCSHGISPGTNYVFPDMLRSVGNACFISLYGEENRDIKWSVTGAPNWLNVHEKDIGVLKERRIVFDINWNFIQGSDKAKITLCVDNEKYILSVSAKDDLYMADNGVKSEVAGMIAWNAIDGDIVPASWVIEGLGHSTKAVALPKGKELKYEVNTVSSGDVLIRVGLVPNHAVGGGDKRYEISVDGASPVVVSSKVVIRSEEWKNNVLRNQALCQSVHNINTPGRHSIIIKALDENMIFDQLMLDFNPKRHFYQIPVSKK
ncbi:glycosyl hydrolase 115 family protein [uncultured Coprobacter sp.]|uniref:glycosyl hydrolase 115 family protein n=1 Tax=Coprobacter secundus TaxID=1501392 RepID=UPI00259A9D44|nr:glycosyl hydrolase 115 family protein [uncultured Coprobacter sp.]